MTTVAEAIKLARAAKRAREERTVKEVASALREKLRGQDGKTPTEAEIIKIIEPLIPDPVVGPPGPPGKDGKSIVGPRGPQGKEGKQGRPGKDAPLPDLELLIEKALVVLRKEIPDGNLSLEELETKLNRRDAELWQRIKKLVAKAAQGNSQIGGGGTFIHIGYTPPDDPKEDTLWIRKNP